MKNKLLLLVMIMFTSFSFSQRNPNQTFLTSFVYEAKEGMTDKIAEMEEAVIQGKLTPHQATQKLL